MNRLQFSFFCLIIISIAISIIANEPSIKEQIECTINIYLRNIDIKNADFLEKILHRDVIITFINKIISRLLQL